MTRLRWVDLSSKGLRQNRTCTLQCIRLPNESLKVYELTIRSREKGQTMVQVGTTVEPYEYSVP